MGKLPQRGRTNVRASGSPLAYLAISSDKAYPLIIKYQSIALFTQIKMVFLSLPDSCPYCHYLPCPSFNQTGVLPVCNPLYVISPPPFSATQKGTKKPPIKAIADLKILLFGYCFSLFYYVICITLLILCTTKTEAAKGFRQRAFIVNYPDSVRSLRSPKPSETSDLHE